MPFGGDAVTFVDIRTASGPSDGLGNLPLTETPTVAPGCRHRPLTFQETIDLGFDIATQMWRTTIPIGEYDEALLSALMTTKADDAIEVNGVRYQIIGGFRPHDDMAGVPFKATVISKLQFG